MLNGLRWPSFQTQSCWRGLDGGRGKGVTGVSLRPAPDGDPVLPGLTQVAAARVPNRKKQRAAAQGAVEEENQDDDGNGE